MKKTIVFGILAIALLATLTLADTQQKNPTTCIFGWMNCTAAFADGGLFASATQINTTSDWYNYSFVINDSSIITNVRVRADFWATRTNGYIDVQVSKDRGSTWGIAHRIGGNTVEKAYYIDVTGDFPWLPANFLNDNFRVRATTVKVGGGSTPTWKLDWIPVLVNYTPFDFMVSVNPTSGSVVQGNSIQTTATVTLFGGLTQLVSLTQTGCPPSSTCIFNPTDGYPTYSSTFTITTTSSTPPGTYPILIIGTGDGKSRNTTYTLNVTSNQTNITKPDIMIYRITFSPPSPSPRGTAINVTANITNIGNATANNFYVEFRHVIPTDYLIGNSFVSSLQPWYTTTVTQTWYTTNETNGTHTIKVTADSTNVVDEWNENNNIQYANYTLT